jgi:hypothetical protein
MSPAADTFWVYVFGVIAGMFIGGAIVHAIHSPDRGREPKPPAPAICPCIHHPIP